MCVIVFVLSFILILKGGDMLVESSVWFASKSKIPPMVVGATIVAIATTFPETTVSFFSGLSGAESLAVNTAIGSMMCNFALVLGISFILTPSKISKTNFMSKVVFFVLALIVLFVLGLDQRLGLVDAFILLIVFIVFIIMNFIEAKNSDYISIEEKIIVPGWFKTIFQFLISAFAIGYGANLLVKNVDRLSSILGISEGVFGLIIISVGTNIPEFVTTLTSIRLKNSAIGIGNIFGSSIIDATMLISITVFSNKNTYVNLPIKVLLLTVPMLILITAIIVFPIIKNGKSNRKQGILLVVLFLVYSILMAKIS